MHYILSTRFLAYISIFLLFLSVFLIPPQIFAESSTECQIIPRSAVIKGINDYPACTSINTGELGFQIPSLGDILTFIIRAFFVIAGLAALLYLLLGALAWITSGGDKEAITAAQQKIQAAVIGMILIVAVLAIIWTLEQVIFNRRICLGLSCPLTLPGLVETKTGEFCCACIWGADASGNPNKTPMDAFIQQCDQLTGPK